MKLSLDYTRRNETHRLPYTQEEILRELIARNFNGMDIFQKILPKLEGEGTRIQYIEHKNQPDYNTEIRLCRLDDEGDQIDSSLEVFFYKRLPIDEIPQVRSHVFPPVSGGDYDIPVNKVMDVKYIATCLSDLFFIEVKPENVKVRGSNPNDFKFKTKPMYTLPLKIVDHPVFFGDIDLVIYSPADTRSLLTLDMGRVTPQAGATQVTIEAFFSSMTKIPNLTVIEKDVIRREFNLPIYFGEA